MRRWRGVIIPEGRETVDGRTIVKGAVSWDGVIRVVPQGSADVWRDTDDDVWAEGTVSDEVDRTWRPEADLLDAVTDVIDGTLTFHTARLVAVRFGERSAWPDLPFEWLS